MKEGHVSEWVETLLAALAEEVDDHIRRRVLYHCGAACARRAGIVDNATRLAREVNGDPERLVERMNEYGDDPAGLQVVGDTIIGTYRIDKCVCPLVVQGLLPEKTNPHLCECAKGWVKAVFESALARPVHVVLRSSVLAGDDYCRWEAQLGAPESPSSS